MSSGPGRHLAFPFSIASDGRATGAVTLDEQVREEVMQLVLTNPGERLFLPEFGGGARRLLFEGLDDNTAALARAMLTQAIQTWLTGRVELLQLDVSYLDSMIEIDITYQIPGTTVARQIKFQRNGG